MIRWRRKKCGCVKAYLPSEGKVMIRCTKHQGRKAKKRLVCHFADGAVRRG